MGFKLANVLTQDVIHSLNSFSLFSPSLTKISPFYIYVKCRVVINICPKYVFSKMWCFSFTLINKLILLLKCQAHRVQALLPVSKRGLSIFECKRNRHRIITGKTADYWGVWHLYLGYTEQYAHNVNNLAEYLYHQNQWTEKTLYTDNTQTV